MSGWNRLDGLHMIALRPLRIQYMVNVVAIVMCDVMQQPSGKYLLLSHILASFHRHSPQCANKIWSLLQLRHGWHVLTPGKLTQETCRSFNHNHLHGGSTSWNISIEICWNVIEFAPNWIFIVFKYAKYHIFVPRKKARHGKHNLWLLSTRLSAAPSRGRIEASVHRVDHAEVSQSKSTEELTPSQGVDQMAEPAMAGILQKQLLMKASYASWHFVAISGPGNSCEPGVCIGASNGFADGTNSGASPRSVPVTGPNQPKQIEHGMLPNRQQQSSQDAHV